MGIKTRLFVAFCIGIILAGGALALLANIHLRHPAYAAHNQPQADLSVVGPPSLPASTVDAIFARLGSPMVGTGALVEQTSRQVNIDDAFALAVWWTETNDGAAGVGLADHNPGSVRGSIGYPSAYDGYTIYPGYSAAIVYWFHMLNNRYIGRGLTSVYAISHPYVGTSTSYLWAGKVVALMLRYRGEALPPTPSPSPTISPTPPMRDRRIIYPIDTGNTSTSEQASASYISSLNAALHTSTAIQQNTALSTSATWLIAAFALVLALAIALCARLLFRQLPASTRRPMLNHLPVSVSFTSPNTGALYPLPAFQSPIFRLPSLPLTEPQTGALVGTRFIASGPTASGITGFDPITSGPITSGRTSPTSLASSIASPSPDYLASLPDSSAPPSTPTAFLPGTSRLRRTQLRPTPSTSELRQEVSVAAGGRPTGLLARYGNTSNA